MKEKIVGIYLVKNKVNGLCYVGQSININKRFETYRYAKENNLFISEVLKKELIEFGVSNFEFSIILECDKEELDFYEKKYIAELKTFDKNFGYNIYNGGRKGFNVSEETRKVMREKKLGIPRDEKTRLSISMKTMGVKKTRLTNYNMKRKVAVRSKVICVETGEVFYNMGHAANKFDGKRQNIFNVILGKQDTAYGYKWRLCTEEEGKLLPDKPPREYKYINKYVRKYDWSVLCVETGEVFPSMIKAAVAVQGKAWGIRNAIKNPNRLSYGYHWVRINPLPLENKKGDIN